MDYPTAIRLAPPGWRHFALRDVGRLPRAVREHELARIPESERDAALRGDAAASERMVRALFWTLVYHLEPQRWDALARAEPVATALTDLLPREVDVAVDVGAGTGRLTARLLERARRVVAVEPSLALGGVLARRLPAVAVVAAWAERLPLPDHAASLTAACGAFGPDAAVLSELRRVTRRGGTIALVSPEEPAWFERQGWTRATVVPAEAGPRPGWIDEFFGPPEPPRELVMLRTG